MLMGWIGEISVGHGALMAIGAVAGITAGHAHLEAALAVGVLAGTIGGTLMGLPSIRVTGFAMAIYTLVIGQGVQILLGATPLTGGRQGITVDRAQLGQFPIDQLQLSLIAVAIMLVGGGIAMRIRSSLVGNAWFAVKENPTMAAAVGIHATSQRVLAFAVSGAYAGAAGVLLAYLTGYVGPDLFPLSLSVELMAIPVIGGAAYAFGPILGSAFFVGGQQVIPTRELQTVLFGIALALSVWLLPNGLASLLSRRSLGVYGSAIALIHRFRSAMRGR
jgi:ABC-type branched-subunit amino acid transport system permease subunit